MKNRAIVVALSILLVNFSAMGLLAQEMKWEEVGGGNINVNSVLIDADNPDIIFAGTDARVIKTEDGGESWIDSLFVKGSNKQVNFLTFGLQGEHVIYAATGNGLFYSQNQGKNWRKIFKGKDFLERQCTTVAVLPRAIYLGTKSGLYISKDAGRHWIKEKGEIGKSKILSIAHNKNNPDYIYVACSRGLFITKDSGEIWDKIFTGNTTEDNDKDTEEQVENYDEEGRVSQIQYVTSDTNNPEFVYLATTKGVYLSANAGWNWQIMPDVGLLNRNVKFLLVSKSLEIYAITESGIFEYGNDKWSELSLRLVSGKINFLTQDKQGNLYVACESGLFKTDKKTANNNSKDVLSVYIQNEPDIRQVQLAAIKYAEVESEKIKRWRRQAANKAWLPKLSLSADRNVTDLYHWEGGSTTRVDDDFLRKGCDAIEWGIDLTWDLGELIYNADQTSIDVRSRLMVELRDDILDEVTKIYYERIRVKAELCELDITDTKKRLQKELRLDELTAYLDGLTGGYFSKHLQKM